MSEVLLVSILLTLVSHINTCLEQKFALIDPAFVQKLLPAQDQVRTARYWWETEMLCAFNIQAISLGGATASRGFRTMAGGKVA